MIKELNHIGLVTANIKASMEFYTGVLGGVVIRDHKDAGGSLFVYIQLALGVIELIRAPADAVNRGFVHVAFLTDDKKDLDEYYKDLENKGNVFTLAPKSTAAGDGRLAFFTDRSGALFELIQRKENIRIRNHLNPRIAAFGYIAIKVSPQAAPECDKFYTDVMNLVKSGANTYAIGADSIKLFETGEPAEREKPLSHICLYVNDFDETRRYLPDKGIYCSGACVNGEGKNFFEVIGPDGERVVMCSV